MTLFYVSFQTIGLGYGPRARARKFMISGLFLFAISPALAQPDGDDFAGTYVALRGSYAFKSGGNNTVTYAPTTPMTELRGSYASGGGGSDCDGRASAAQPQPGDRRPLSLPAALQGHPERRGHGGPLSAP